MKKILILSGEKPGIGTLAHKALIEQHGQDIVLVTAAEAREKGLSEMDFDNIPKMVITPTPQYITPPRKSGKENRRDRRKAERSKKFK